MKPYEKFMELGPQTLSEEELLAIIIRTGSKDRDALSTAGLILNQFPDKNLLGLYHIGWKELTRIPGIGQVKAIKLKCIAELAVRISKAKAWKGLSFRNPESIAEYYMEGLRHEKKEKLILMLLDGRARLLRDLVLSIGSVKETLISPREIFIEAVKHEAVYIVLLHNHPSGNPTPSSADKIATLDIDRIGRLLDIPLMDHIIIGDNSYYSFKQEGLI